VISGLDNAPLRDLPMSSWWPGLAVPIHDA
jgi:hypothetical protein